MQSTHTEAWLRSLYYVLLILLLLYFFYVIYQDQRKNDLVESEVSDIINENKEENQEDISIPATPIRTPARFEYQKISTTNLRLVSPSRIDFSEVNSTVTLKDLQRAIQDESFINQYRESIRSGFQIKLKRYVKILQETISELKAIDKGTNSIVAVHDTNLNRLKKTKSEIEEVILAVKKKLTELNNESVLKGLKEAIYDRDKGIESLIGREEVKDFLAVQIISFAQNSKIFFNNFQNIIIFGKSGVGKTKLAETIGFVYSKSGILARQKVKLTTSESFKSSYVNEAASLTKSLIYQNLEQVLFCDEIYALLPPKSIFGRGIDHGEEAVSQLVNDLDKLIGLTIFIGAGYKDQVKDRFLDSNEGLQRRFSNQIELTDYDSKQLTDIFIKFVRTSSPDLLISSADASYIFTIIDYLYIKDKDIFEKQAGDVLNLSQFFLRTLYSSKNRKWTPGDLKVNASVCIDGFNAWLKSKNKPVLTYSKDIPKIAEVC